MLIVHRSSSSLRLAGARPHDRGRLPARLRSAVFALALSGCGGLSSGGPAPPVDAAADVAQIDAGHELEEAGFPEAAPYDAPGGPECPFIPCKDGQSP